MAEQAGGAVAAEGRRDWHSGHRGVDPGEERLADQVERPEAARRHVDLTATAPSRVARAWGAVSGTQLPELTQQRWPANLDRGVEVAFGYEAVSYRGGAVALARSGELKGSLHYCRTVGHVSRESQQRLDRAMKPDLRENVPRRRNGPASRSRRGRLLIRRRGGCCAGWWRTTTTQPQPANMNGS